MTKLLLQAARAILIAVLIVMGLAPVSAQPRSLLADAYYQAIRDESSGERPLVDFGIIETEFSGFSPSRGGDRIAEYLAARSRQHGLSDVKVEGFPADGRTFFWTFLTEPSWDGEAATLTMLQPRVERLADFAVQRVVLGRFSGNADVTADLVDAGAGTTAADFEGKNVSGKVVLAYGPPGAVHAEAVWRRGAAGVVWYRAGDSGEQATLIRYTAIVPWTGPQGEPPGFVFGIPSVRAVELQELLRRGERVTLRAFVRATTMQGEYKLVNAVIPGADRTLPEVYVYAHDNYRNSGGANNLSGVGATVEISRVLNTLIAQGKLPQPRRSIRFLWGAEHYASTYNFFNDPDERRRILAMLNVDMTGFHQERAKSVFRLYRTPHSRSHFVSDVAEDFMHLVGYANRRSISTREMKSGSPDPTFAPAGTRDQLHYKIEDFWGPSDHEDVGDGGIGVAAVMYNDWPDPYLSTQADDISRIDPTQMRRSVMTVASTAYYLASILPDDVIALGPVVLTYAEQRMAADARRASRLLTDADAAAFNQQRLEALNIIAQSAARETRAMESLLSLGDTPRSRAAVTRGREAINALTATNMAAFSQLAIALAAERRVMIEMPSVSAADRQRESLVPRRNTQLLGVIHTEWLKTKTGGANPATTVPLYQRGTYVPYETLNFVDGTRTVREIRDAVSAEYGPVEISEVEQFFRLLEKAGVVSLREGGAGWR